MVVSRHVREAVRRKNQRFRWKPLEILFDQQQTVFKSGSRYKILRCGRRSGKSYYWAVELIDKGIKFPKSTPLFVTMSRQDGRDIIWPALEDISDRYGLGLVFNRASGDVFIPQSGSTIKIRGAGSMLEINKLRGKKYPIAVVDEAQAFGPDLEYLIDEALEPATADYHGTLGISGTPNCAAAGPFFDMDVGEHSHAWDHFHWTFLQNPTMPDPHGFIEGVMRRRGWTEEHTGFRREYLGLWIRDDESRAFKVPNHAIVPSFSHVSHLATDWSWYMGIDVGFHDPFAFVVIASSMTLGQAFVVDCYQEAEIATMEALTHAEHFCATYPITEIALDTGGAGRLVAEDWRKMSTLPIKAADKSHKHSKVDMMNGDMQAGKLFICRENCSRIISDLRILEWDSALMEKDKFVYRKGFPDHLADALQYGYSLSSHHQFDRELDQSAPYGSATYWQRQEDAMEAGQRKRQAEAADGDDIWSILESSA